MVLAGLRGEFTAWVLHAVPDVDAALLFDDVQTAVSLAVDHAGLTDLTSWTPAQVRDLTDVGKGEGTNTLRSLASLPLLADFLVETDRWTGPAEGLDALLGSTSRTPVLRELGAGATSPGAEASAVAALPLVAMVTAFLRWFGPTREVTASGGLRRADVLEAADQLGIDLGGRRPTSMWDVAQLDALWSACAEAGLLAVARTSATRTELGERCAAGASEEAGPRIVAAAVSAALTGRASALLPIPAPAEVLAPLLVAALTGNPQSLDALLPDTDTLPDPGVRSETDLVRLLTVAPAQAAVARLTGLGVLVPGGVVTVTPGLERLLTDIVAGQLDPPGARLPAADPELAGRALRLRIELVDSHPAIWRRVIVGADTTLAELHQVIQRVFAWEDIHLHEFMSRSPMGRSTVFALPDPDGDTAPSVDERTVTLDQVLGGPGTLHYRYDFGDSWDHLITLERTEDPTGALPRCTGGRRAAPMEDSGGVISWAALVTSSAEDDETREWLGLAEGETFDPEAFDPEAFDPATFDPAEADAQLHR